MLRLAVAKGCMPTGALLGKMLLEQGVQVDGANPTAVVSWGVRLNTNLPSLNAMAGGRTKYAELEILHRAGINVPWFCPVADYRAALQHLPVLARRHNHRGGSDIRLVRTPQGVRVWAEKRDFFTQFIENDREYRVQIYRSAHLGTYEKVLERPEERHRMVGRNHRNGYGFQLRVGEAIPRPAVEMAKKAVECLGLDFGAVDVIHGRDGKFYVLEVNSAPGGENGRQWLNSLVKYIVKWERDGYPGRKHAE